MAFSDLEKLEIRHLKDMGASAFGGLLSAIDAQGYEGYAQLKEIFFRHIVVTGGMFASLLQHEQIKDIDIYILDYDGFLTELESYRYPYFREMILRAGKNYDQGKGHRYALDRKIEDVFTIRDTKYQIMTTSHIKREELISNFDYKHTTISWHNGKLYLTEKSYRAAKEKLLIPNKFEAVTEFREQKFLSRGYTKKSDILVQSPPNQTTTQSPYDGLTGIPYSGVVHVPPTGPSNGNGIVATGGAGGSGSSALTQENYIKKLEEYMKQQIDDAAIASGTYKPGSYKDNHYQQILHDILQEQAKKLFAGTNTMTNTSNVNVVDELLNDPYFEEFLK